MAKPTTMTQYENTLGRILLWFLQVNEDFVGATASADGEKGMVPQPNAGDNVKFLKGDGTWANPTLSEIVVGKTAPTATNAIWLDTN